MARRNPVAGLALGDFLDRSPVVHEVHADPDVMRTAVAGIDERTRATLLGAPVTSPRWFPVTTTYAHASERRHPSTAHVLDLLPAYLVRRLRLRERDLVAGHLNACPDCDRVLRELQDLPRAWAALGDAVVVGPPEGRPARAPGRVAPLLQSLGDRVAYVVERARRTVRPAVWGAVGAGLVLGGAGAVAIGSATAEQRQPEADPVPVVATTGASASPTPAAGSPSPSPSVSATPSASPSDVPSATPRPGVDESTTGPRDDQDDRPAGGTDGGGPTEDGTTGSGGSQTGPGTSTGGGSTGGSGQQPGGSGGQQPGGTGGGEQPGTGGDDTGEDGGGANGGDGSGEGSATPAPSAPATPGDTGTPTTPGPGGGTETPPPTGGTDGGTGDGTGGGDTGATPDVDAGTLASGTLVVG
jgi:hypothetical protein